MRIRTPYGMNPEVYGDRFAIIELGMPLRKNIGKNIRELVADNKKGGKARGMNGKKRSKKQIIAIALNAAGKSKKKRAS